MSTKRIEYSGPRNRMSNAEFEDKYRGMVEPFMSSGRIDEIFATIHWLEQRKTIEPLTKLFAFDGETRPA